MKLMKLLRQRLNGKMDQDEYWRRNSELKEVVGQWMHANAWEQPRYDGYDTAYLNQIMVLTLALAKYGGNVSPTYDPSLAVICSAAHLHLEHIMDEAIKDADKSR